MDHSFVAAEHGESDKTKCKLCKFDWISHQDFAICDRCQKKGKVWPMGQPNGKYLLVCKPCEKAEIESAIRTAENPELQQQRLDDFNARIAHAQSIDSAVRYNGDFFNNPTVPIEDVRASIYNGEMTDQQKKETFNKFLSERMEHFKNHVFLTISQVRDDDEYTKRGTYESLRDMASSLHKAMREKLVAEDKNYVPPVQRAVKPRVKKAESLSTFDRFVQSMMNTGMSRDEAIEAIRKGSGGKLGTLPK